MYKLWHNKLRLRKMANRYSDLAQSRPESTEKVRGQTRFTALTQIVTKIGPRTVLEH